MTLHLTPTVLAHAYDFLRVTRPFNRWKLPLATDVDFYVSRGRRELGYTRQMPDGRCRVAISEHGVAHLFTLIRVMAHEMVHVSGPMHHGAEFRRKAALVCKHHGFDPKEF